MRLARWCSLALAWGATLGCSVALPGELERVECSAEGHLGPPACDPGQVCARSVCTACQAEERCGNAIDDDCNGLVDDGCHGAEGYGAPCADDAACLPELVCVGGACTRTCCRSEDCPEGWVCGVGKVCQRAPGLALGGLRAGAHCETGGVCRSGRCEGGRCVDTCCASADCGAEMSCAAAPAGARCRPAQAGEDGAPCHHGGECSSNACLGEPAPRCAALCCSDSDCGGAAACAFVAGGSACAVYDPAGAPRAKRGEPCGAHTDCASGVCEADRCEGPCCTDADCPAPGERCRPLPSGRAACRP
ncbi:MAG: hypothetical protein KIT72_11815 [Polyangiaceae bacterium]|nr:hypothetical protein [Polyangiaceae bacterium]MCW5791100.1 hypothetical protein [Polyangiaceae bacterium]